MTLGKLQAEESVEIFGGPNRALLQPLTEDINQAVNLSVAVAFLTNSGFKLIEKPVRHLLDRGGELLLITGDYQGFNDPKVLRDLLFLANDYKSQCYFYFFRTDAQQSVGYHPKGYLVELASHKAAFYVGSSNLTSQALQHGIEWNYRAALRGEQIEVVAREFQELVNHKRTTELTEDVIREYEDERSKLVAEYPHVHIEDEDEDEDELAHEPVEPHEVQMLALKKLAETRQLGNEAGLVVLATGLGKTWLSAFDSEKYNKVLFVAHREEILKQAKTTFKKIRPRSDFGDYSGGRFEEHSDVLFASIQTLGREKHLNKFPPEYFDYIIIDEFHHAAAKTYRRVIEHFAPKFLLGLTATPDRTDRSDLVGLCGDNLVYRCDFHEGIERRLLSPFKYFGVADEIDFRNIPWRNGKFDPQSIENAVVTSSRAKNALDQWSQRAGRRTLGFCVSVKHANYMAAYFAEAGLRTAAVHAGKQSAPRADSLQDLAEGNLDIVFAVDMFNEGVDIPEIDTVMMLRPTESKVLRLQQLGRGLRKATRKPHVTVIDYIGNHRSFLKPFTALFPEVGDKTGEISKALQDYQKGNLSLPPGCEVTYDLESIDVLRELAQPTNASDRFLSWYQDFKERNLRRPKAVEAFYEGYDPLSLKTGFGSWFAFLQVQNDLEPNEATESASNRKFLEGLEATRLEKSFKILVLKALLGEGSLPSSVHIDTVVSRVSNIASKNAKLKKDFGGRLGNQGKLRTLLETQPIKAWCNSKAMGGEVFFYYENNRFGTGITSDKPDTLAALASEIADYRLSKYISSQNDGFRSDLSPIRLNIAQKYGSPYLIYDESSAHQTLPPAGSAEVSIRGEIFRAEFSDIGIDAFREEADLPGENLLSELLRDLFGDEADASSNLHQVQLISIDGLMSLEPVNALRAELWRDYMREEIPRLWGLEFNTGSWRQGHVATADRHFLLVTLDKEGMPEEHNYQDTFVDADTFEWVSQNRTKRNSSKGNALRYHLENKVQIHLFVRKKKKTLAGKASPFTYCGEIYFEHWDGDAPINIRWKLKDPLPTRLLATFSMET